MYEFWTKRRVFVTGHTGFKGTWLSLWLQALGADVTGYALADEPNPACRMFEVVDARAGMASVFGDVRDRNAVSAAMRRATPTVVFHLAAQALVRRGYRQAAETFDTNLMGTVNVLEACRECESVQAVVVIATDKCYENHEWVWGYRETDVLGGYDPYSASKACAELAVAAYRRSFFAGAHAAAIASGRAGNVIGGGDWAEDRLIPDVVRSFSSGTRVLIRSPHAIRPWQHVLEPLSGYLLLAQRLIESPTSVAEAWNFGPDDYNARPVSWVIEYLSEHWGQAAGYDLDPRPQPHEAGQLRLDTSKARQRLAWRPRLSLEQTLDWLIAWYRRYYDGDRDMRALTLSQIRDYEAMAPVASTTASGRVGVDIA